jgi:beta-lactam-binding protein with PASTA domain
MLLALGAIALVALGALFAWLLLHQRSNPQTGTTVVLTTQPAATAAQTTPKTPAAPRKLLPDLSGLKLAEARARLSALGLRAAITTVTTSGAPAGSIVDQAPKGGGRLPKGSTVTLSVATAPPTTTTAAAPTTTTAPTTAPKVTAASPQSATVPDVQGEKEAGAVQRLGQAGILASLAFVPGSDPLGTVLEQAKPSGTAVPYHAHVQINISRGPADNPLEQVPNVIGKSLQDAVSALQGAKLRLIYLKFPVTSRTQAGKVVQQSPLSGGQAPENAEILVFLGAYRPAG